MKIIRRDRGRTIVEEVSMEIFASRSHSVEWVCTKESSMLTEGVNHFSSRLFLFQGFRESPERLFLENIDPRRITKYVKAKVKRGMLVALGEQPEDHGFSRVFEVPGSLWWTGREDLRSGPLHEFPMGFTLKVTRAPSPFFSEEEDDEGSIAFKLYKDGEEIASAGLRGTVGSSLDEIMGPLVFIQEGLIEAWRLGNEEQGKSFFPSDEADLFRAMGTPLPIFWEPADAYAWLFEYVSAHRNQ